MANKPYIEAREASPFGEAHDYSPLANPTKDVYELPGYSDKRREREIAVAKGEHPGPLPFRVQLVPTARVTGKPDRRKEQEYRNLGYKPMTEEDAKTLGIDLTNSAYEVDKASKHVILNENLAMWAPREVAARNFARLNELNRQQKQEVKERIENAVEKFNAEAGLSESAGGSKAIFELD